MSIPFMTNQLGSSARLIVEAAWGANLAADASNWTWTDITSDVRQVNGQGITITIGRPDEFSQAPPATCMFELKNQTGAYTPYSPTATNYPNLRQNTPIRVQVTINGITKFVRFFGYANGFTPGWDADGRAAYVTVSASGTLRRLLQNTKPLKSALYRKVTSTATVPVGSALPDAYWPLEEGDHATLAATPTAGVQPLQVVGNFAFAANNDAPGAGPQPDFRSGGGRLFGQLPGTGSTTSWRIQFPLKANPMQSTDKIPVVQFITSSGQIWEVALNGTSGIDVSLTEIGFGTTFHWGAPVSDGFWHEVRVTATYSAPNTTIVIAVDGDSQVGSSAASTLARLTTIEVNPLNPINTASLASPVSVGIGHLQVWNTVPSVALDTVPATHGFAPFAPVPFGAPTIVTETADVRLPRLMSEEGSLGLPLVLTGTSTTPTMGPQTADTFVNLLRECEATDGGLLLDGLSQGLNYVCRSAFYNQSTALTVDANSGQVPTSPGITPVDDDQRRRNRVIAQNKNGTSATVENSTGVLGTSNVGTYEAQVAVNAGYETVLDDIASWLVHRGTVEGFRYPTLYLDLAGAPELATSWLGTTPSERIDLTNLSNRLSQHPVGTVSLILEGYSEVLTSKTWRVSANCSPYRPWEVFQIADSRLGRLQTDGSSLATSESTSDTSFTVASNPGPVWDTGATPFDIEIEGEQITVTTVRSAVTDAFGRTVSNGFGNADSGQAYTTTGGSASDYSVTGGTGRISNGTRNVSRVATVDTGQTDVSLTVDCQFGVGTPTGGVIDFDIYGRLTGTTTGYLAELEAGTSGTVTIRLWKQVSGVFTALSAASNVGTNNLNDIWRVTLTVIGSSLSATAQNLTTPAGPVTVTATDSSITTGTLVGWVSFLASTNTNTLPVVAQFDNFAVANPQTFTVTRSVNGVVKAHNSGATVKLWRPGVLAL